MKKLHVLHGACKHHDHKHAAHPSDGPLLPPSLTALRLESGRLIDLGDLAQGEKRLSMATGPTLAVRAGVVLCRLERMVGGAEPHAAHDTATALHAEQFLSRLPARFAALEMHSQRIAIHCDAAVQEPTPEAAALQLCLFFAHAPASYRHFSLRWPNDLPLYVPLYVNLSWPLDIAGAGSTALVGCGRVAFDRMDLLAKHFKSCAATLNMSVVMTKQPTKRITLSRL